MHLVSHLAWLCIPAAIGSGSPYALAAARALIDIPGMDAMAIGGCGGQVSRRQMQAPGGCMASYPKPPFLCLFCAASKAMRIAADACIYTNTNFTALSIDAEGKVEEASIK